MSIRSSKRLVQITNLCKKIVHDSRFQIPGFKSVSAIRNGLRPFLIKWVFPRIQGVLKKKTPQIPKKAHLGRSNRDVENQKPKTCFFFWFSTPSHQSAPKLESQIFWFSTRAFRRRKRSMFFGFRRSVFNVENEFWFSTSFSLPIPFSGIGRRTLCRKAKTLFGF